MAYYIFADACHLERGSKLLLTSNNQRLWPRKFAFPISETIYR